jgi:hypothetical protein
MLLCSNSERKLFLTKVLDESVTVFRHVQLSATLAAFDTLKKGFLCVLSCRLKTVALILIRL